MKKLILFAVLMLALIMTAAACNTGDDNGEPPVSTDAVTEAPTEAPTTAQRNVLFLILSYFFAPRF